MKQGNVTTMPGASGQPVRQQQPDFSAAGFGRRLTAGLDALVKPLNSEQRAAT